MTTSNYGARLSDGTTSSSLATELSSVLKAQISVFLYDMIDASLQLD